MANIPEIVDGLILSYEQQTKSGVLEPMPVTSSDRRVEADKEGRIGVCLARLMSGTFRRYQDKFKVYTGRRYEDLEERSVSRVVSGFIQRQGCAPAYLARSVKNIVSMVMNSEDLKDFRPRRDTIYMRNCVIVIGDGGEVVRRDFSPDLMSNIYLDFDYVEFCRCPEWEKFLSLILDDSSAVRVLQEFLGCMFIDKRTLSIERALFLYGTGGNGKSVVFETLAGLLGDNVVNLGLDQINNHTGGGDYYTASLAGKLLAYNSDSEPRDIASGKYKQLISKERVAVRNIYKSPFETDDWPMFMANINKPIITSDSSVGFWRRNMVLGCQKVFCDNPDARLGQLKADKGYKFRMRGEFPGIFNWILEGRRRIIAQNGVFTESKSIESLTKEMRDGSSGVNQFLVTNNYQCCEPDASEQCDVIECSCVKMLSRDIYREYRQFCVEYGYEPKNISRFKDDMVNAGFVWQRSLRIDGQVSSGYVLYRVQMRYAEEQDACEVTSLFDEEEDLPY